MLNRKLRHVDNRNEYDCKTPTALCNVTHPQKHHPRIDFPTRYISFGETLRANCTTAPALPAPHITWFINGRKMDELVVHSHKYRVPLNERRRGLQKPFEYESGSAPPPVLALTHISHVATKAPGCNIKENQIELVNNLEETNANRTNSRHRGRRPSRGRDLYVSVSEIQLLATGRLEVTCVSTIPEFRSIDDKFADVRNDTVIVDLIKPSTYSQESNDTTKAGSSISKASNDRIYQSTKYSSFQIFWRSNIIDALQIFRYAQHLQLHTSKIAYCAQTSTKIRPDM
ncbi:hypothetical protein RR46_14033 [Papilio xuthus]|uniref:Ig-like domain-containing protein n=1 Tax=Papilio xuthus TaxID=66420 RepID=A0A194PHL9_PAPXU|nr:hypothetical protein RR46_14033 [Papilio xuthus]